MSGMDISVMLFHYDLVFLAHSFPLVQLKRLGQLESGEHSKQIHNGEDDDPDNIDEVPVQRG